MERHPAFRLDAATNVKMVTHLNVLSRFNAISIRSPVAVFAEMEKTILIFVWDFATVFFLFLSGKLQSWAGRTQGLWPLPVPPSPPRGSSKTWCALF